MKYLTAICHEAWILRKRIGKQGKIVGEYPGGGQRDISKGTNIYLMRLAFYISTFLWVIICQNCGFGGEHIYCSNCGQLLQAKRIDLRHLFHEVSHTFWHLEKGFLFTLKELGTGPGTMQRRYLSGLRLRYQKPFPLFAISGTLCALSCFLFIAMHPTNRISFFTSIIISWCRRQCFLSMHLLPIYFLEAQSSIMLKHWWWMYIW